MILLSDIYTAVQYGLKNTVATPITQDKFIEAANRAIDILLTKANYSTLRRITTVQYLDGENDYDINSDLGVSDYNEIDDLRPLGQAFSPWSYKDERIFASRISQNVLADEYTVEERSGKNILRINRSSSDKASSVLETCDSLTSAGTWQVISSGDAENLTLDTARLKEGAGCLNFDIDADQSVNNSAGVEITLSTAVDISAYQNIGRFRFWIDFQKLTSTQLGYISSVELRVGSSSSDYLAMTATSAINNGSFVSGWNKVSFNWEDGTTTGSPDFASMDYIAVIVNYSASMTDATDIRVDEIKIFEPEDLEFSYFSSFMVAPTVSSNTFQERFSTTYTGTEALRLPRKYLPTVADLILSLLYQQKNKDKDQTHFKFEEKFENGFSLMMDDGVAFPIKDEEREINIQAHSRTEEHLQW